MKSRSKLERVSRLREIEEVKLRGLSMELASIQSAIAEKVANKQSCVSELENTLARTADSKDGSRVSETVQTFQWIEQVNRAAKHLESEISVLGEQRDNVAASIEQQRKLIKGWEQLIDNLSKEVAQEIEKAGYEESEESYLRKYLEVTES